MMSELVSPQSVQSLRSGGYISAACTFRRTTMCISIELSIGGHI